MISVPITLEQLIQAVKNLQPEERSQVAKALVQSELEADLTELIQSLYNEPPADDISDADILAEIRAVRQQPR
ncbi:MAG: hypothetical protein AAF810_21065 [Cyanobacteria bacterium P01_D01_bin.36]